MADPYPYDFCGNSAGITFRLPSRRRFIPNAWLLHADMNEEQTEIQIHYTHSLAIIQGTNLDGLHDQVAKFGVSLVQEMPRMPKPTEPTITRIEITEKTGD
jgi:hypothetical protein